MCGFFPLKTTSKVMWGLSFKCVGASSSQEVNTVTSQESWEWNLNLASKLCSTRPQIVLNACSQ